MRIRWTQPAAKDLAAIGEYIEEQDGAAAARRITLALYERVNSLKQLPHRGRIGRIANTRELVVPKLPYLVVYRIREDVVEIARIRHGAQKWP